MTTNPIPSDAEFFAYQPGVDGESEHLLDGRVLTEELMDALADEAAASGPPAGLIPGGKSLSGDGSHSPRVVVTLPRPVHEKVVAAAHAENMSVSKYVRRLIESSLPGAA